MAESEIAADPTALEQLAARISQVHDSLTSAKVTFGDPYGGLQSATVEGALEHFNASWNQKRGLLVQQLADAEQALGTAAEAFRVADTQLAGTLGGDTTTDCD